MHDWTYGYVADVEYVYNFFKELTPAHLAFALVAKGFRPPDCHQKFHYCELGFGQGVSLNLLAAANPHGEFWGTDFNPSHAAGARLLGRIAGNNNTRVFDRSFEDFLREDTPQFDFIALHGVYSWISPENRQTIVQIVNRKLKCGGALYISYNTLPGWSAMMPLRELMTRHSELSTEPTATRVEKALGFARRVADSKAAYFLANPGIQQRLDSMMDQNRRYLAHEYFNSSWNPQYFSEVSSELAAAKVVWIASARLEEHIPTLTLTPDAQKLLLEISDPNLRETVRDYCNNTQFRRDIFIKGPLRLPPHEQIEILENTRFVLTVNRSDLKLTVNFGAGEASLAPAIYAPIANALATGPKTLKELMQLPELKNEGMGRAAQAVSVLIASEQAQPCLPLEGEAERKTSCDRFNEVILERARYGDEIHALASPVTGSGVVMNRLDLLALSAVRRNVDPADEAWSILQGQGHRLLKDGVPMEKIEDNVAEVKRRTEAFRARTLPILRMLKVV